jgi:hypothetical protein
LPHSLTAKGLYLSASTHQAIGIGYTGKKLNTALQIDNVPSKTHTIMLAFSWNNAWAE